jgi:hypothetical protein
MYFYFGILPQCSVEIFMKQVKNFNLDFYEFVCPHPQRKSTNWIVERSVL